VRSLVLITFINSKVFYPLLPEKEIKDDEKLNADDFLVISELRPVLEVSERVQTFERSDI
jgi:hypothetical protein